jgi:hypothetical protein
MFDGCRRSDRALGQAKEAGIDVGWQRFDGTKILVSSKHKLPDAWRAVLAPNAHP